MRSLFVLVVLTIPAIAAPVPKALTKTASLDGRWLVVAQTTDGMSVSLVDDDHQWVVSGNTLTLERVGRRGETRVAKCTFESVVDTSGPRTFEYKVTTNTHHRRGVCELDGDTLRVAFSTDNTFTPREVKSGQDVILYTFRRVIDSK